MGKSSRRRNFDQQRRQPAAPLAITVYGREYIVPGNMPLSLMPAALEFKKSKQTTAPPEIVMQVLNTLFGSATLQEWSDKGMSVDQLNEILTWIFDQWAELA
jgi:hypothetical protein